MEAGIGASVDLLNKTTGKTGEADDIMKKRVLGKLYVSEIGIGCMGFSHGYGQIPDEETSIEAIQAAYRAGCNFFDTAEAYGPNLLPENRGHNERIVAKAMKMLLMVKR